MAKKDREWVGNKGEWSELYVFLKLLAQGAVQAIDDTYFFHDLGFSIKSFIGKLPTLVNASQTTNFVYKIEVQEG